MRSMDQELKDCMNIGTLLSSPALLAAVSGPDLTWISLPIKPTQTIITRLRSPGWTASGRGKRDGRDPKVGKNINDDLAKGIS